MAEDRSNHPEVVHGIEALRPDHGRLFVVIGVFDGLHLGHLYLLRHLQTEARVRGARSAVITFDHHPDEILVGTAPPLLCDPYERLDLLAEAGVEVTVVQTFNAALRMTAYDAFIQRIAHRVDLAGFLMTPDAAFGHERRGTVETVGELGRTLGYEVVVVPALELGGRQVRSSDIRAAIGEGKLAAAAAMLGRPYTVTGRVGSPDGTRPILRFPMPVALPPAGEYAVDLHIGPDEAAPVRGMVEVRVDGTVAMLSRQLEGRAGDPRSDRLRVTFVSGNHAAPAAGSA